MVTHAWNFSSLEAEAGNYQLYKSMKPCLLQNGISRIFWKLSGDMRMIFSFFKLERPACDLGWALLRNPGFGVNNTITMLACHRRRLALPWQGPGNTLCLFLKIKVLHIVKTILSLVIVQSIIPVLVRQKYINLGVQAQSRRQVDFKPAQAVWETPPQVFPTTLKKTRLPQCPFWHLI